MPPAKSLLIAAAVALAPGVFAGETAPRRLGAPQMMKLDWGVDAVRAADIDGDGRTDLAALNNDTGRIELLFRLKAGEKPAPRRTLREDRWNPTVDDAPFRRLSVSGSPDMGSLALADIDGDGRIDIAYTSSREALTVIFQDKAGEFSKRRVFNRHDAVNGDKTLVAADIGGKRALVMLSKAGILVFKNFAGDGALPEPTVYRTGVDNPYGLSLADLNGDGVADIAYIARGERPELRVRFGDKTGGFGPEHAFRTEYATVDLNTPVPAGKGATGFAGTNMRKRAMEIFAIRNGTESFKDAEAVNPALYTPASPLKSAALVAVHRPGDGADTMFVGDARGAAIQVYRREKTGDFGEPVSYPAPPYLTAVMALGSNEELRGVLTIGEKEPVLGLAKLGKDGRLGYPVEVKIDGTPVAVAPDAEADRALVVVKDAKDSKKCRLLTLSFADGEAKVVSTTELDSSAKDATGINYAHLGGSAGTMIIIPCSGAPALLLKGADGKYEPVAKDSPVRKSVLNGINLSDITFGNLDEENQGVLLVAGTGYIRVLKFDAKGEPAIVNQINTRRPGDKVRCPFFSATKGLDGVLFYNETDKGIEWLTRDDKGVYRHKRTIETGSLDPVAMPAIGPSTIFVGKEHIAEVDLWEPGLTLSVLDRYETDLPGTVHAIVETGRFTGGKTPDAVLIDPRNHRLELVSPAGDAGWKSVLNFGLYDENPFYRGRRNAGYEPHDTLAVDLDGDGFPELVLLMHDRLLVYPSEPAK